MPRELKETKYCKCGCGTIVKNKFVHGHNARVNPPIQKKPIPKVKLCKCGCGEYANPGKVYIWGHNGVGDSNPMRTEQGRERYRQSMLKKYGVDNNMKMSGFRQKVIDKRRLKKHYHLGNDITPERVEDLKKRCSKAGKRGGKSRAQRWKEYPEEFKNFLSKSHNPIVTGGYSGANHPCWRGGTSLGGYESGFFDEEFQFWLVNERDQRQCQNPECHRKSKIFIRHHIDHDKKNGHPMNLITLCYGCHMKSHWKRTANYWKLFYQNLMLERARKEAWPWANYGKLFTPVH